LIDTTVPICGNSAQRPQGQASNDGPKNIIDSVQYITSRVWADQAGNNRAGVVLIQEQQIFAARDVQKGDARPGGYVTTGGHGGIIGGVGHDGPPVLTYLPATRHTHASEVNISRLPARVDGVKREGDGLVVVPVPVKDAEGYLLDSAIPKVAIVKDGTFHADDYDLDPEREVDLNAIIARNQQHAPLSGFVIEGLSPYGFMTSRMRHLIMRKAVLMGMPVVRVGRGNNDGFSPPRDLFLGGRNLTATKARLLLMACLMRFGALPPARDPDKPSEAELQAIRAKLDAYQKVFDTH
jgi:L-asparaginase